MNFGSVPFQIPLRIFTNQLVFNAELSFLLAGNIKTR